MKFTKTATGVGTIVVYMLGMGLFLAWTVGDGYSKAVAQIPAVSTAHALDIVFGVGFNVATLAAVALCAKRIGSIVKRRNVCIVACMFAVGGPALMTFAYILTGNLVLMSMGSALRGVAAALLFLKWNELFARFPIREASICYAGAYLVSVVVQLATSLMSPVFALCVILACPVVSTILLFGVADRAERQDVDLHFDQNWAFPWRPLLLAMVYTFTAFAFFQLLGGNPGSVSRLGSAAVALVCLTGCLFFFEKSFDATVLGLAALPLMVAAREEPTDPREPTR